MEIGITWENKLVYNKEIKVNKKVLKTGAIIVGVGVLGVALTIALTPPADVYAFTLNNLGGPYDVAVDNLGWAYDVASQTNKNGKLINDTILNTAQAKDLKMIFDYTINPIMSKQSAIEYLKTVASDAHGFISDFDLQKLDVIIDSLLDRGVSYPKGEIDIIKVLKQCMFN